MNWRRLATVGICFMISLSLLVLAGCGAPKAEETPTPEKPAGKRTLVVSGWSGLWEESFMEAVVKPFEELHPDVEVIHFISGPSGEMVAKLRAEKDNPTIDVYGTGSGFERIVVEEGLVAEFDPELMPNLKDVHPSGLYKNAAVANSFNGVGLAYHKERVPREPTSWYDLWDPDFAPVAINQIASSYGYSLFAFINELEGGTEENQEPGWAKYRELAKTKKPLITSSTDETVSCIVTRGIALSVATNSRSVNLMKEGYPLGFVYPKEGALAWGTYMTVVKGTGNEELAMEFINFWLDPEVNGNFCSMVNYGPANQKAVFPPDYAYGEYLMWGDRHEAAWHADFTYLRAKVSEWNELWTTDILPLLEQ